MTSINFQCKRKNFNLNKTKGNCPLKDFIITKNKFLRIASIIISDNEYLAIQNKKAIVNFCLLKVIITSWV